jgi:hypothetical protein
MMRWRGCCPSFTRHPRPTADAPPAPPLSYPEIEEQIMTRNRKSFALTALLATGSTAFYGPLARSDAALAQSTTAAPYSTAVAGDDCSKLAGTQIDQVVITSARTQAAMAPVEGAGMPSMTGQPGKGANIAGLPEFCRVVGAIHPEAGSDIRFEVWLPTKDWTGRMMGAGNGGLAGTISYLDLASAVRVGQVGAATDTGHSGTPIDSDWAKGHPERVRDYGWRAMHLTTTTAKTLVRRFYGRGPDRAYLLSCSNGGRMGLMEASRFPEDYDGILAGAPASAATGLIMSHIWLAQTQMAPGSAIRPDQVKLLQREVLAQCDGIDGHSDSVVDDPRQCRFDAAKLACGANASPQCFAPPQLEALREIHEGPRDKAGRSVGYGFPATGSEVGAPVPFFGWDGSVAKGGGKGPIQSAFPGVMLTLPLQPIASDADFDFDKDPARVKRLLAPEIDPQPDLKRFYARGGKLIMWHGWADATIPPQISLDFYRRMLASSGSKAKAQSRLFMVPGVQHCFGGPGPDQFGQNGAPPQDDTPDRNIATALADWVEKGRVPQTLTGRLGFSGMMGGPAKGPEKERLICAYPAKAVLGAGGDPDKASSYMCKAPPGGRR